VGTFRVGPWSDWLPSAGRRSGGVEIAAERRWSAPVPIAGSVWVVLIAARYSSPRGSHHYLLPGRHRGARPYVAGGAGNGLATRPAASASTAASAVPASDAILLESGGVMDLRAMAVVTAAITVERLARPVERRSSEPSATSSSGTGLISDRASSRARWTHTAWCTPVSLV